VPQRIPSTPETPIRPPRKRIPVKFFGGVLTIVAIGVAIFLFSRPPSEKKVAHQSVPATPKPTPEFVETIPSTPPVVVTPPTVTPPATTPPPTSPPVTIPIPTPDAQAMMKAAVAKADALQANKDWAGALRAWLAIEKENADVGRIGLEVLLTAIRKDVHGDDLLKLHDLLVEAARLDAVSAMAILAEALKKSDPSASFNWLCAAAERGDRDSMTQLGGVLSARGDYTKAFVYFEQASEQGDVFAKFVLGDRYMLGKGVKQDMKRGVQLLQEASDAGNALAADRLGYIYQKGIGVDVDLQRAFKLFSQGHERGNRFATANLGVLYMNGEGTPPDPAKAVALFEEGSRAENPRCMLLYARCLELGVGGVRPNLLKARFYYRKAATAGDPDAVEWCKKNLRENPVRNTTSAAR
jgi:TPR repeat protein